LLSRNIGFQRAVGGNEDKKQTLRQVITEANAGNKPQTTGTKKKWRKKGKLLGKGNFVDTHFVTGIGEVCIIQLYF
jgi:hypothetical protein